MLRKPSLPATALVSLILVFPAVDEAQTVGPRPVITQAIDENKLVTLAGNTRLEANRKNDLGPVGNDLHLDMYLQLKRSPEEERAAQQFVESLTDKASPNFHRWISASEYGRRFGVASEDIAAVSRWLKSHGFTVNSVPSNNMVIDFSGNAGQVREALHTEIHNLGVAGKRYFANMSDPQIPAALLPAVTGVVSLNNLMPHKMLVPRAQYTVNPQQIPLVPGDLATIYNLNPAFSGGFTGQGQTIVVVEDTDLFNGTGDWGVFRQTFGLTAQFPYGSLTQVHPAVGTSSGLACSDPGINGDDDEAALDVEWASAAAPNAAIVMASCADTTNFGGFIALQNLLTNGGPLPSVVSISYGESETDSGTAGNSYINTLYQTAAAAGVSVFVSSGDEAAAETDNRSQVAIHGVSVSSFASTPYDVAVGGTDFGDFASGTTPTFWNSSNGTYYNSAKSYVPEIPWNNSCGSAVLAIYKGYSTTYGASGYCNGTYEGLTTVGGSGGPSGCATGTPAINGVVGGTCAGYSKPSWQAIAGNPGDGVRDLPDVALFASSGFWGHYYVFCISDGASCSGAPSTWAGAGGTSFASPIMAGIQALINQAAGSNNVGNPNPVYYKIGQNQYGGSAATTTCNSTSGCSFNDVTQGDMDVPCAGAFNCYFGGGGLGVLSTSNTSYEPAYGTAPGWDFATGIGSINGYNLLTAFVDSVAPSSAPIAPVLVSPANGATGVLPQPTLTWNASAQATSYDVHFGTASTPPLVTNTANINYAPATLAPGTTYYWAVGARNNLGANASAAWSFTTSCVGLLNPSSAVAPAAGGTGAIPVTATAGCGWTAVSNVSWISITSGGSGTGNGTVSYAVAADTVAARAGTITIAGQTFTVTQTIYPLISTLAGGGLPPTVAPGASVSIPVQYGVAVNSSGNTYFSSPNLNAVFKADPTGVVTRIAGTGVPGYSGDSGPALNAQLYSPQGVAVDSLGNVYIADSDNRRIRKISVAGTITTVAGNGSCCSYTGDGGAAISAQIGIPYGLAVDSSGNLYICDINNDVIRKVATSGTITTMAGNGTYGYSGDGGAATSAEFRDPFGLAVDASGNLYIADTYNNRIRKVSASGIVTTVAGNGNCCSLGDGGPATSAWLNDPYGVTLDAMDNLYVADGYNDRIRKVTAAGLITTVAGNGIGGYAGDGGMAGSAELYHPSGVAVDPGGNLRISDSGNARIRSVSAAGTISTVVGGAIGDGGLGVFGYLNQPSGVARDNAGNTYVADTYNNRVRKVAANGTITTVAGTGAAGFAGDGGAAASAPLNSPEGLVLDTGNLYIADSDNYRVRKVAASGTITTVAGNGICCGHTGDGGAATSAQIGIPYGLAVDSSGNVYISDIENNVIRKVSTAGTITTVAGNGTYGYAGDGGAATTAEFRDPFGVAVDASGNLYIADTYNYRVRMVSASGIVTTVAGNGTCCFGGDGGPATGALLSEPYGVAVDASGDLYIADYGNSRIRKVTAGTITTVAGDGGGGFSGDGGAAINATLQYPWGISVDAAGNVAFADSANNAVRLLTLAGTQPVLSIQSAHTGAFSQGQTGATYTLTVTNGSGAGPTNGAVTVTEIVPAGLTLASMAGAGWTCTVAPACTRSDALVGGSSYPAITVTVNVSATAPGQLTSQASVSGGGAIAAGRATDLTLIAASIPPQPTGGIANAASAGQATPSVVSLGSYVAIYGTALAGAGSPSATSLPLPTTLNGTQVSLGGLPMPLLYASATQINALIPQGLKPNASYPLVVITGTTRSVPIQLTVTELQPGIYTVNESGSGPGIVTEALTGQLNNASNPAHASDFLVIYCTGLGPLQGSNGQPGPADGAVATANPLFQTTATVTATVGGISAPVSFSGLTPTFVGLYQVNIQVPVGVTPGNAVPLVLIAQDSQTGANAQSNSVTIAIQ